MCRSIALISPHPRAESSENATSFLPTSDGASWNDFKCSRTRLINTAVPQGLSLRQLYSSRVRFDCTSRQYVKTQTGTGKTHFKLVVKLDTRIGTQMSIYTEQFLVAAARSNTVNRLCYILRQIASQKWTNQLDGDWTATTAEVLNRIQCCTDYR